MLNLTRKKGKPNSIWENRIGTSIYPCIPCNTLNLTDLNDIESLEFEDSHWTNHLRSLKPLGLASILASRPLPVTPAVPDGNTAPKAADPNSHHRDETGPRFKVLYNRLVHHVCHYRGDETNTRTIKGLGEAIGFQPCDTDPFQELFRFEIIAPHLNFYRLIQQAHGQSIEEVRWKGTLHSHMTSVVVADTRTKPTANEASTPISKAPGMDIFKDI